MLKKKKKNILPKIEMMQVILKFPKLETLQVIKNRGSNNNNNKNLSTIHLRLICAMNKIREDQVWVIASDLPIIVNII